MKNNWISSKPNSLPDFIIGGAMKCGTTTLHDMLGKHPKIYIPKNEVYFFSVDDMFQHSDYNFYYKNKWLSQTMMKKNPQLMWDWYYDKFKEGKGLLKGVDSTTYLASKVAAERISMQNKDIKLLFILRHPTSRAYSNYFHLLRNGMATYSFEDTIRNTPFQILNRSLYKEQLEIYYKLIPNSRIKVVLFEDMIKDTENILKSISEFLNIDYSEFPSDVFKTHSNKAKTPFSLYVQQRKNYLFRNYCGYNYEMLPNNPKSQVKKTFNFFSRAINYIFSSENISPPKIKKETKVFLDDYFKRELDGIDELVGQDIMSKWFPNK